MDKTLAKLLSGLFHPILMPFLGIYLMFRSGVFLAGVYSQVAGKLLLVVFICTIALPILFIPALIALGVIRDVYMNNRRERVGPFMIGTFFYLLCYLLFLSRDMPGLLTGFLLSFTLLTFLASLVSLRWKISVHMTGIGGVIGLLLYIIVELHFPLLLYFTGAILVAGLTAWARLRLRVHSPAQVYAGFFLSFITVYATLSFY
jgi:hypothetical protein